jgi:hypothetical protein
MTQTLLRVLVKVVLYLAGHPEVVARVRDLVATVNHLDVNGERKRSQVLNALISEFPQTKEKDLAFLLELVLQAQK